MKIFSKRVMALALIITTILSFATVNVTSASEDSLSRGFSTYTKNGKVSVHYKHKSDLSESYYKLDTSVYGNFVISADITRNRGMFGGILVRYQSEKEHYLLRFAFEQGEIQFLKKINGGIYDMVGSVRYSFPPGESHRISLQAIDDEISLFADEKVLDTFHDSSLVRGGLGFYGRAAEFSAENVALETIETENDNTKSNVGASSMEHFNVPEGLDMKKVNQRTIMDAYEQVREELPAEFPVKTPISVYGDVEIFVSISGDDKNGNGSIEKPFKTLEHALRNLSYLKKKGKKRPVIYLREGTYPVENTIKIGAEHSGTEQNPLIISAYNGEKVSFVGGYSLEGTDFHDITNKQVKNRLKSSVVENIKEFDLAPLRIKDYGNFSEDTGSKYSLYADGERQTLARYPNNENIPVTRIVRSTDTSDLSKGFELGIDHSNVFQWQNTGDIWIYGAMSYRFHRVYYHVDEIDEKKKSFTATPGCPWGNRIHEESEFYFTNVLEELDSPGEWFIDKKTEKLYYYPYGDINQLDMKLAMYSSDILTFENAENVVVNGITVTMGAKTGITMSLSNNCMVQNSNINNMQGNGVMIERSTNCGIIASTLYANQGADIIMTCKPFLNRFEWMKEGYSRNFAQNNFIYNTSESAEAARIWLEWQVGNIISHNFISHPMKYGIRSSNCLENVIEFNEICGGPNLVNDMGQIYCDAKNAYYITIRNNYLHDASIEYVNMQPGVYLDTTASWYFVYNNIIYNQPRGVFSHGGKQTIIENNIGINPRKNLKGAQFGDSANYYNAGINSSQNVKAVTKDLDQYRQGGEWYQREALFDNNKVFQDRYPLVYDYLIGVNKLRDIYKAGGDYSTDPFFKYMTTPNELHWAKNIAVDARGKSGGFEISEIGGETATGLETNWDVEGYRDIGFYDIENCDFRIKDGAEIYEKIPDFKDPKFERMGLLQENSMWETLPKLTKMKPLEPSVDGISMSELDKTSLRWTPSLGADYYEVELARDENFNEILFKGEVTYPSINVTVDAENTKYFWRVKAISTAKSIDENELMSDTWSFRTMSSEELAVFAPPSTVKLEMLIGEVEDFAKNITEGNQQGEYKTGTKDLLKNAISEARKGMKSIKSKSDVEGLRSVLEDKLNIGKTMVNPGYVYLSADDFDRGKWSSSLVNTENRFKNENDELIILPETGGSVELTGRNTGHGDIMCFKMKVDNFKDWMGILAKINYQSAQRKYWNILQLDQLELQYVVNGKTTMQVIKENNGEIFKSDTWHDFVLGSIPTPKGVWNILLIDGKEVANYLDTSTPIYDEGHLTITVNSSNGNIHLKPTETRYEQLPMFPEEAGKPVQ